MDLSEFGSPNYRCPHCGHIYNFAEVLFPTGEGAADQDVACPSCGEEGIGSHEYGKPDLKLVGSGL